MEFNIQTDPEAARMVFESGVRLTMVPLEVTHTALVSRVPCGCVHAAAKEGPELAQGLAKGVTCSANQGGALGQ